MAGFTRSANAEWNGDLKSGKGTVAVESGTFDTQYSFKSRFETGTGTNPEELIAAAHAGCFSMAFANMLSEAGFVPDSVKTTAKVKMEDLKVTEILLETQGSVPEIDEAKFQEIAEDAKKNCPISQALAAVDIKLDAKLV
jgi:osmotically inducible protein OsmC